MPRSCLDYRAERYRCWRQGHGATVRERGFGYSERHLQCAWYDDRVRPERMYSIDGECVEVLNAGRWNLEAGPDFLDAEIVVDGERRLRGDVEIHIRAGQWCTHGHTGDPRYGRVRLHVSYYPSQISALALPPGCLQVSLSPGLELADLGRLDISAYPYAAEDRALQLRQALESRTPDELGALLDAAGAERLSLKIDRFKNTEDWEQSFYAECMAGLGYKRNSGACRELAQRVPVQHLREVEAEQPGAAFAVLMGVAGLLPNDPGAEWGPEARCSHRKLWHPWWRLRSAWSGHLMDPSHWQLGSMRPLNHPSRRLAAAADLFTRLDLPALLVEAPGEGRVWVRACQKRLQAAEHDFLSRYANFGSKGIPQTVALVGRGRAAAILINAALPALVSIHGDTVLDTVLHALPAEDMSSPMRETANALFGRDHNPEIYRDGLRRQGLIQIFEDFCLSREMGGRELDAARLQMS